MSVTYIRETDESVRVLAAAAYKAANGNVDGFLDARYTKGSKGKDASLKMRGEGKDTILHYMPYNQMEVFMAIIRGDGVDNNVNGHDIEDEFG